MLNCFLSQGRIDIKSMFDLTHSSFRIFIIFSFNSFQSSILDNSLISLGFSSFIIFLLDIIIFSQGEIFQLET